MATSELKTLEKLVKEILEKVKNISTAGKNAGTLDGEAIEKITSKLETIDERLAVPKTSDAISAEIISKMNAIDAKLEEKSEDYIREIQLAFDTYCQRSAQITNDETGVYDSNLKDFVSIITNEMMEIKTRFEQFNTEFTDISLNTGMALSKEVVSLKNYVLSMNDALVNIKDRVDNFNPASELVEPISDGIGAHVSPVVEEVFNASMTGFKKEVFALIAKVSEGIGEVSKKITDVSKNLKTFEGIEMQVGEVIQNQQRNKEDIIKIIQNSIDDENQKLLPQIMQIVNSVSFEEDAEEIKDGLYAINENLGIINKNIENGANSTAQVVSQVEEVSDKMTESNKNLVDTVTSSNERLLSTITTSNDELANVVNVTNEEITTLVKNNLVEKIAKIDEVLDSISVEFNILTKGSKEETGTYLYTLQDLETDISKVRIILDELAHSIQDDRSLAQSITKNISDKISAINDYIEKVSASYTTPDYKALLLNLDSLNDDISSISKRTNKLILTSDDSSEKMQKNVEDFKEILDSIKITVKSFEGASTFKKLNNKCDAMQKQLSGIYQSDKAINEAFVYLASWIDTTSEDMKNIQAELEKINQACSSSKKDNSDDAIDKLEKILLGINKQVSDNSKRLDMFEKKIEQRLDTIATLIAENELQQKGSDPALTKKINKIEKQIQQLLSYVEE